MATERIYHPETCEPFDVPASKAQDLVLNKGWSRTPWTLVDVPAPAPVVVDEEDDEPAVYAPRGRGRGNQRRGAAVESTVDPDDDTPSWRN